MAAVVAQQSIHLFARHPVLTYSNPCAADLHISSSFFMFVANLTQTVLLRARFIWMGDAAALRPLVSNRVNWFNVIEHIGTIEAAQPIAHIELVQ